MLPLVFCSLCLQVICKGPKTWRWNGGMCLRRVAWFHLVRCVESPLRKSNFPAASGYTESQRAYHTLSHLDEMFGYFQDRITGDKGWAVGFFLISWILFLLTYGVRYMCNSKRHGRLHQSRHSVSMSNLYTGNHFRIRLLVFWFLPARGASIDSWIQLCLEGRVQWHAVTGRNTSNWSRMLHLSAWPSSSMMWSTIPAPVVLSSLYLGWGFT